MTSRPSPQPFDAQHAANYDDRWAPLAPLRDSLHLQMRLILRDLPAEACVLCVGAGTGAELLALAGAFPDWRFVAVDPAAPMLDVCRRRAAEAGCVDRCEFHAGYVHELPPTERFDAATSILVSQFLTVRTRRVDFFRAIARRLRPGATLVTADLAPAPDAIPPALFAVWQRMMNLAGATPEQVGAMLATYGRDVALVSPGELESLLVEADFHGPVHFSQTLLIHAWFATRAPRA